MSKNKERGLFLVVEGPQGSGKTTLVEALERTLREPSSGMKVTRQKFPSEGILGKILRAQPHELFAKGGLTPRATAMLYLVDMVAQRSAIEAGCRDKDQIVVCDRYFPTTGAYQRREQAKLHGQSHMLLVNEVDELVSEFLREDEVILPDIYVQFFLPIEVLADRLLAREGTESTATGDKNDQFSSREEALVTLKEMDECYRLTLARHRERLERNGTTIVFVREPKPIAELLDMVLEAIIIHQSKGNSNE